MEHNIPPSHFKMKKALIALILMVLCATSLSAQGLTQRYQRLLTDPQGYVVYRTASPITIDGIADETAWQDAPVVDNFRDISGEGFPLPLYHTSARMLWDDDCLYIAAELEEPNVWAYITQHDEVIYQEPDFEVFIDPDNDGQTYFEMEFNAIGTLFDLFLSTPYCTSSGTFISVAWDAPGIQIATHINGTINDDSDTDQGWNVELAIPKKALANNFDNPLKAGSYWRLGFSRVEWQTQTVNGRIGRKQNEKGSYLPEYNWTWPATGQINMHMPERWNYLYFSNKTSGTETFRYPADHNIEKLLWATYYAQHDHYNAAETYFQKLKQLGLSKEDLALLPDGAEISMEATKRKFEVTVTKPDGSTISVDENHCIRRRPNPVRVYGWSSWDQEHVSEDSLRSIFKMWKRHGMTGVCMNCGFEHEKTARCAAIAHEAGLEYHAWACTMLQGGMDSTWYAVNRWGQSAYSPEHRAYVGYYQTLDPHNPEVIDWLVQQYLELASIPNVDYVQLDYIRYADVILAEGLWDKYQGRIHHEWRDANGKVCEYPGADYCYCDACCADFKVRTGIDIKAKLAEGIDPANIPEWAQFRCDNVTRLVNTICKALHEKGYRVSADVFPGPHSYAEAMVRQQWDKWECDMFFPMNYNDFYLESAKWVGKVTEEEVKSTVQPVISGLFICRDWKNRKNIKDPEGLGLSPNELKAAMKEALKASAFGVCLFTPDRMTEAHWKAFEKAVKGK